MTDPDGKDMELAERVARRIANSKYKTWDRIMGFLDCLILELRAEKEAAVKEARRNEGEKCKELVDIGRDKSIPLATISEHIQKRIDYHKEIQEAADKAREGK